VGPGEGSMALAWMRSGSAVQYLGYLSNTWYGHAGWGMQNHLFASDTPSFAEAFRMNILGLQHYLHDLRSLREQKGLKVGKDEIGLKFDEQATVLYGNPALEARLVLDPKAELLVEKNMDAGKKRNGKQRYSSRS